ncbi:MAG: SLC13 family permease [Bacteroidales bacterium]|nr:SLC13 family permease [Bacteroidales bacterium]
MVTTIIVLLVAAVFFAMGKVRSDLVALCALLALMMFGILSPAEALSGFSNTVVILMVGLFVVGGAIFQTGLAKKISGKMMNLAGNSELRLFLLVMLVTAFIGAFVSNTGTVALMLPIVVSLAARARMNVSRLLIPLAFSSSLGGMLTLIGTPPNLVIQETLVEAGYEPLSFFSFAPVGVICIAVGMVVLLPLSRWFLGKKSSSDGHGSRKSKSLHELVREYHLTDNLVRVKVDADSLACGKTVSELDIHNRYALTVYEVRREKTMQSGLLKTVNQRLAGPQTELQSGDIIYIIGEKAQTSKFVSDYRLAVVETQESEPEEGGAQLDFYDIGIAEIVMMPTSRLVNRKLKESGFRSKYHINIVGVRRKGQYIMDNLAELRLHGGDVLLVQGTWENISRLNRDEEDWVVLGQPLEEAEKVTLDYKAPLAACIMLLMIALMVFDFIPVAPVTAVMFAGVLMVLSGCFRNVEAAYKTINWESIVLIAAMLPMSVALEKTGASALVSRTLAESLGHYGPYALLAGIYFSTSLLTLFISNTATAVLMAPIALSSAAQMGLSPYPFLFAVTLGASMCFATPFSTPPNALVMQAGRYTFMDYVKVGLPLQVIVGIVMVFALPLLFGF